MSSEVLNIKVEPKVQKKSKSSVQTNSKKDKPSLFDKMIDKNKSKQDDTSKTKSTTSKAKVQNTKTNDKSTKEIKTNIKKPSLFDNLKTTSKKIKVDKKVETSDTKEKKEVKTDTKKPSLFDNLKTTSKKIKVDKKVETSDSKEKKEVKTDTKKPSLFDNLKTTSKKIKVDKKVETSDTKEKKEVKQEVKIETTKSSLFDNLKQTLNADEIIASQNNQKQNTKTQDNKNTKNKKSSLLDKLVANVKEKTVNTKNTVKIDQQDTKENLNAKTFLSNQQTKANIISKHQISQSKQILLDENNKDAKSKVKQSANKLDLGFKDIDIISEDKSIDTKHISKIDSKVQEQNTFLSKVLFKQALNMQDISNIKHNETIKKTKEAEVTAKEIKAEDVQIKENTQQTAIQNITNKIISARQNMKSFMSDMARKMYENYKPPVTAFKINLNPAHLGSISITMKSEKATNSISISMKTSNSSTLEVLEGAKGLLQNSLQKTFENQSSFSLDFSQQDGQSNMQEEQNKQNKKEQKKQSENTDDIIENDISINDGYM